MSGCCKGEGAIPCPNCFGWSAQYGGPYCAKCANTGWWPCDKCDTHLKKFEISGADQIKKLEAKPEEKPDGD